MSDKWGFGEPKDSKPIATVILGDAKTGRAMDLVWGEHPHSRSDNRMYARWPNGEIYDFDGHRLLIDIEIRSHNYLKESELSGDEIRKGGHCAISADGVQVFEFPFRDPLGALLRAHSLVGKLMDHSSGWMVADQREKLVGRKVWYERTPATIDRLIVGQGCLILKPDGAPVFPQPVWADKDEHDDERSYVKVEVLDPHIWWWRE